MSKLDRDRRDAERTARRAERIAERAMERATQKAEQAVQAAARAERLAEEVRKRSRPEHILDESIEDSIEDSIEEMADKVSRQTEEWRNEKARRRHHRYRSRRRREPLYRDTEHKKICGVCAGVADYFGKPAWVIRVYALIGLIFIPSVMLPIYFAMYFILDDKPYYRRVADRFDDEFDSETRAEKDANTEEARRKSESRRHRPTAMDVAQAMQQAREKFSDIEQRMRCMETHVTSSRFELQREFKKISGEAV